MKEHLNVKKEKLKKKKKNTVVSELLCVIEYHYQETGMFIDRRRT
jgi:hypothetical protein